VQSQGSAVLEECADENCVITLGTKIGADYMVRGIISKLRDRFTLAVEIYETEDGNLVGSATPVRAENIEELVEKVAASCAEMYEKFVKAQSSRRKRAMYAFETGADPAEGGSVVRNPDREEYAAGSKVSVLATPENGYVFTGWSGAAVDTANPVTVTIDTVKTLTAHFAPQLNDESAAAFALAPPKTMQIKISAGAGGFFANNVGGGFSWKESGETVRMSYSGGGGYIYVDFKYVEISAGWSSAGGRWEAPAALDQDDLPDMRRSGMIYSLYGKWPINLGKIRIFPLMSVEFEWVNTVTNMRSAATESKLELEVYTLLSKAGIGVDYDLTKNLYARAEALYGILMDSYSNEVMIKADYRGRYSEIPNRGLTVRAAVGFRIW